MSMSDVDEFEQFVLAIEPRLRRALVGRLGVDQTHDATAHALAWAWENWAYVATMKNPAGYLYRVAQARSVSRTRS